MSESASHVLEIPFCPDLTLLTAISLSDVMAILGLAVSIFGVIATTVGVVYAYKSLEWSRNPRKSSQIPTYVDEKILT